MKILVTGCAGFIGSAFCRYLLKKYPSDYIYGVDAMTYAASPEALEYLMGYTNFTFARENICDREAIDRIFSSFLPDVVVNFAAETHVDRSIDSSFSFTQTNLVGTDILLSASLSYGVKRYHQVSTDEVYGDLPYGSDIGFTEESVLRPSSPYSASKAGADLLALSYMKTHGLPVSISRSSNNYGIYQHTEKLIPMTIGKIVNGMPVQIYGDGRNMRDWLYVDDNCRAIDLIIRAGDCGVYNVGADNEWSNIDLVKKIMGQLGMPDGELVFVPDRKGHDRRYPIDSGKIRSLGWQPEAEFEEKLKATVEWYRDRR